ncbi:MAG: hypothetical protein IKB02_03835 [Clostridia bacterium]|nr:hypothetical protein [Clostridia bacterium]
MTFHNAQKYILTAPTKTSATESLERTRFLCEWLNSPQRNLKYIRFAGSNGKTVCQTMLASILHENGNRVGSLLMPVHDNPRENVIIGKDILSIDELQKYVTIIFDAVNEITEHIEKLRQNEETDSRFFDGFAASLISGKVSIRPTKNETIFLVALLAFKDKGCDICLIESDHNGTDPSKILTPPETAVICGTIPPENTKEISRIRSYISNGIKEVISAPQDIETRNIISSACAKISCRLSVPVKFDITRLSLGGSEFSYSGKSYRLSICGKFQIQNAVTAIEVANSLRRSHLNISDEAIQKGLTSVSIPTKFETVSVSPTIIVDSTHKVEAVGTMCATLGDFKELVGENLALCICPDTPLILEYLAELNALGFTVSELIIPAGAKPDALDGIEPEVSCPVTVLNTPKQTAKRIIASANEVGLVLVTAPYILADKLRTEIYRILSF